MENNSNNKFEGFTSMQELNENPASEINELSFFDVFVGVFTEPSATFEKLKQFPVKTTTWLYPILIFIVFAVISNVLIMSNPEIKSELMLKQKQQVELRMDKMVKDGKMSQEQADKAVEQAVSMMDFMSGWIGILISVVSVITMSFAGLLIVSGVYWLIWVKILNGHGEYKSAVLVNGLSYLIGSIEVILIVVFSLIFSKWVKDISIGALVQMEDESIVKAILSKINPLTFWMLYIIGIGMGKMFNVEIKKSLLTVCIVWLIYVIVAIGLSQVFQGIFG